MMKNIILIALVALFCLNIVAQEEQKAPQDENKEEKKFATYSEIEEIRSLPDLIQYMKDFVSWKHWRYWLGLVISIISFLIIIFADGMAHEMFPEKIKKKLSEKDSIYNFFWVGYSFLIAVFFTFGYQYVFKFFSEANLLTIPKGEHWISWVLWTGLVLLTLGAVWALIRELIVFKFLALFTILHQIISGLAGMIAIFFLTTAVTYFIIAIGIILGVILVIALGLVILFFLLFGDGTSSSPADSNNRVKVQNREQKKRNEDYRRWKEKQEKYNREQLKKTRGW